MQDAKLMYLQAKYDYCVVKLHIAELRLQRFKSETPQEKLPTFEDFIAKRTPKTKKNYAETNKPRIDFDVVI